MRLGVLVALVACQQNPSKLDNISVAAPARVPKPSAPVRFDAAAIDAWVASEIAERGTVGASLVVIRDGKIALANGYGKKRGDAAEPVTADTPFALGSVSKQFACAAAYMLSERGGLAMIDPVSKYYPALTRAADITLADLGGHTSGYRDYYPLDYVDVRLTKAIAPDELITQYAKLPLDFEPRTRWSYSNTGFVILARVIERVSGKPYAQLLDESIFKPLGMTASLVRPPSAASGHVSFLVDGAKPAPLEAEGWLFGMGDIWASANDVAKWDAVFFEGKLLTADSLKALTTSRTLANGKSTNYSCGLGVRMANGETVIGHSGWVGGFHTRNTVIPRTKSAVILLTNDEYTSAIDIADKIVGLLTADEAVPAVAGPPADEAARELIRQLQANKLDRTKLGADAAIYFDSARVAASSAMLRGLGDPVVTIKSRGERGGLEATSLSVAFPSKTFDASMFRAPDGKIHQLLFERD